VQGGEYLSEARVGSHRSAAWLVGVCVRPPAVLAGCLWPTAWFVEGTVGLWLPARLGCSGHAVCCLQLSHCSSARRGMCRFWRLITEGANACSHLSHALELLRKGAAVGTAAQLPFAGLLTMMRHASHVSDLWKGEWYSAHSRRERILHWCASMRN
jgi:hypothetical protein